MITYLYEAVANLQVSGFFFAYVAGIFDQLIATTISKANLVLWGCVSACGCIRGKFQTFRGHAGY